MSNFNVTSSSGLGANISTAGPNAAAKLGQSGVN